MALLYDLYMDSMEMAGPMFFHLFGRENPCPAGNFYNAIYEAIKQRSGELKSRFRCDEWETVLFELYGSIERGYVHARGSSTVQEGYLYVNDVTEGDHAWFTIGTNVPVSIAGNIMVTGDRDIFNRAKEWLKKEAGTVRDRCSPGRSKSPSGHRNRSRNP